MQLLENQLPGSKGAVSGDNINLGLLKVKENDERMGTAGNIGIRSQDIAIPNTNCT
jgi:hypothetical protein